MRGILMRALLGAVPAIPALILAAGAGAPAAAQEPPSPAQATSPDAGPRAPNPNQNISATGKMMPPTTGRAPASESAKAAELQDSMLKAQKATDERNKAWDARMRKTMGSICSGC